MTPVECRNCGVSFAPLNHRSFCYECLPTGLTQNQRVAFRTKLLRAKSSQMKMERGCAHCGYAEHPAALDWHHLDMQEKELDPGDAVKGSLEKFEAEIAKCIVLCANCHRIEHS